MGSTPPTLPVEVGSDRFGDDIVRRSRASHLSDQEDLSQFLKTASSGEYPPVYSPPLRSTRSNGYAGLRVDDRANGKMPTLHKSRVTLHSAG